MKAMAHSTTQLTGGAFSPADAADINMVAAFLALDDVGPEGLASPSGIDCVIWAGNNVLHTAEQGLRLVRDGAIAQILLSGGVGHATPYLWRAVASHENYGVIETANRPEAEVLAEIAERFFHLDSSRILVESGSTNSGENAGFSRRLLEQSGLADGTFLLIQDPTMQRRADATFRHVWRDRAASRFLNWPTFTPRVKHEGGELVFALPEFPGLWDMERFLALLMGEIPRLRDDPSGYGPQGRGFIAQVSVPEAVEAAHQRLRHRLGSRFGGRMAATGHGGDGVGYNSET